MSDHAMNPPRVILPYAYRPALSAPVRQAALAALGRADDDAEAIWRFWASRWLMGVDRTARAAQIPLAARDISSERRQVCRMALRLTAGETITHPYDEQVWQHECMLEQIITEAAIMIVRTASADMLRHAHAYGGDMVIVIDNGKETSVPVTLIVASVADSLSLKV